jgi:hypothetical protein
MATLLSITTRRRVGVTPGARYQAQAASVLPIAIRVSDGETDAQRCAGLAALTVLYYRRWQPSSLEERQLVDLLIASDWQLRRLKAGRQWLPLEPA